MGLKARLGDSRARGKAENMLSSLSAEMAPYKMQDMRRAAEAQRLVNSVRGAHARRGATTVGWLGLGVVAVSRFFHVAGS